MKSVFFEFIKIGKFLMFYEIISIMIGIAFAMNDGPRPKITDVIAFNLQYICGFPLVLINDQYPFFLDSGKAVSSNKILLMWGANFLCQILFIYIIKKMFAFWRK